MRRYVVVDGNVGAGKSTLLAGLSEGGVSVLQEPVERWCSGFEHRGSPVDAPLELFYRDPIKNALPFQIHVITTRIQQLLDAGPSAGDADEAFVVERDPFDTEVFVEGNFETGAFDSFQHKAFVDLSGALRRCLPVKHVGNVYLRLDPDICMARINERGRRAETGLRMEHLRSLHRLHEAKYSAMPSGSSPRSIVVDARLPPGVVARIVKEFVASL